MKDQSADTVEPIVPSVEKGDVSTALAHLVKTEALFLTALAVVLGFLALGDDWVSYLRSGPESLAAFIGLFVLILVASRAVVRHAENLSSRLGEPYGTLILTLSVISVEIFTVVMVMLKGANNPTLARDTMFSVIMIVFTGLLGLALLMGGLRHREQQYNLQGTNAFLSVAITLAVLGLVMPNYTEAKAGRPVFALPLEVFLIIVAVGLYLLFLLIQTTRHRNYFVSSEGAGVDPGFKSAASAKNGHSVLFHSAFLIGYLVLVIFLAEKLATLLDLGLERRHAPPALGGLIVAILVLAPEGMAGIRAAMANEMQRAVNILLGSALSTLALTIPAVLVVGLLTDHTVVLGVEGADQTMLLLALLLSVVTFASGRTNILQGAVHLILFVAFLMLVVRT
ncbi:MAG: calcium:proton antiporter [Betaproteobacteria bacterium]